jgi:hypothetical protein
MKKITSFLVALTLLFSAQTMKAQFAGGDGSAASPFQISNRAELRALDNYVGAAGVGKHFALTADIDLTGDQWVPIATWLTGSSAATIADSISAIAFRGKLHGEGHKIKNMVTDDYDAWFIGLFGQLGEGALIENLHLDSGISGSNLSRHAHSYGRIASLVGRIYLGVDAIEGITIQDCSSNVQVIHPARNSNTGNISGGLVGEIVSLSLSQTIEIASCSQTGNVSGAHSSGGLIGLVSGYAEIHDSYFDGDISRTYVVGDSTFYAGAWTGNVPGDVVDMNGQTFKGGLVGQFNSDGTITN